MGARVEEGNAVESDEGVRVEEGDAVESGEAVEAPEPVGRARQGRELNWERA